MSEISCSIFKKDTKGKIRVLHIQTMDGMLYQKSGLIAGKLTVAKKLCKAKNIGRSNETTPKEQAWIQAESKVKEKLKLGYFNTIEEAENTVVILPMLAKSFKPEQHKIDWNNAYAQPKFDGQRCLAFISAAGEVILRSRIGTPIETMPHIIEAIKSLNIEGGTILDGELYIHGHTFQENMRLIKKIRPGSEKVDYHIYDVIQDRPFSIRHEWLMQLGLTPKTTTLKSVVTHKLSGMEMLTALNNLWVEDSYEGSMVRWGDEFYKVNGRSSHLLKNKAFLDTTAKVMDILPNDADPTQGMPLLYWKGALYKSSQFGNLADRMGCGVKGSHDFRRDLLTNKDKYIGQSAELRFFEYSEDGIPRFPVFCGFRNDK